MPLLIALLQAQTVPPPPAYTYEVVSIHKSSPEERNVRMGNDGPQGGLRTLNTPVLLLTRLSHLEGMRTDKGNEMSKGDPKVFTTNGVEFRNSGTSTGCDGAASAVTVLLILGGGWAGSSMCSVSSRICTSGDGCV